MGLDFKKMVTYYGAVVKPDIRRVCVIFLCLLTLSQVACSQEDVVLTAGDPVETESAARELRIYRSALQQGSTEDIRVDAAIGLLLQNDAQGRDILLSTLKSEDNPQARQAVCRALIKSRGLSQTIDSLEIFRLPLLEILRGESVELARLAAETMLLFDYSDVSGALEEVLQNQDLERHVRMNAVYALQLRPEPTALRSLIKLLDDPDAEVAKAAETALQEAFGIPVGTSRAVWSGILDELQLKSPEEIRRERLLRQEMKLRQVQAERDRWQKLYLDALDKQYESDEAGREKMIRDMIESDMEPTRLWALDKASKLPVIGEELGEKLLSLLSDNSRDVRLQAARALMNMPALNPAAVLLERLQLEEDAEVKLAMLEALGEACFFAFSRGSEIKLPEDIKLKTLEIASEYLRSESADDCIKGAEVIRKILELNSLGDDSMQSYLGLLDKRYKESLSGNEELRAELLAILAHLCGQGGAKESACALFGPLFIDAITVENAPALRLAAVQGVSYVDKVRALELFKQNGLIQDQSLAVQQVVIEVAGQTGDTSDLDWLLGLLAGNGQSDRVWPAIKSICQRQQADFLMEWLTALESADGVTDEYVREILDIAEQKAAGEKNEPLQIQIQQQILSRLVDRKSWESALTYLDKIGYDPLGGRFSPASDISALKVFLYSNATDRAVPMLQVEMGDGDLPDAGPIKAVLDDYFMSEAVDDESKSLSLMKIKSIPSEGRPNWSALISSFDDIAAKPDLVPPPADEAD